MIIPVFNEADCIEKCLLSLRNQTFKPLEILVVDDGSTDNSAEVSSALKAEVIRGVHKGPGTARNLGARSAKGNILVLVDADMTFAPDYVANLVEPIIKNCALASCHWNEQVANWENPWARCETWFSGREDRRREPLEMPKHPYVYRAVRKDFFIESGGFSENEGRGDDSSLARRTGVFSVIVPDATCYHRNVSGPGELFREAVWRGRNVAVIKDHRLRRCVATMLIHQNPLISILHGMQLGISKREPRMPVYAAIFSAGMVLGILHALVSGNYQK